MSACAVVAKSSAAWNSRCDSALSRSSDGVAWSAPVAAGEETRFAFDKEWLTCDNGAASPLRGSCYLVWSDELHKGLAAAVSHDGGLTWSAPVAVAPGEAIGAQPLVPSAAFSQRQAYTSLRPAKRARYRPTLACKLDP